MRNRLLVLTADDDPAIRRIVSRVLELNGFDVIACSNGSEALRAFEEQQPQLVILDIRMPEVDGLTVCREIRAESDVPVIMLTALEDESDAAAALEAGADDYIRKPFGTNELLARIKAVLRRALPDVVGSKEILRAGDISVDMLQHEVRYGDEEIKLSRTEFSLLAYLLRNPNRVLTQDQILEQVWGPDYVGSHHVLRVCMSRLRQRFPDPNALPVESLAGVGYRLRTR
ncbi:MAG TPA: response regulator transcription factor [Dehalococcoidia bacterium]|nr:response regulator transcription factor [Dehalococcoidia bacterium]